jgi:WD40 repeat protein/DNA-binding winged helix-turn-helix (wHTH) protein
MSNRYYVGEWLVEPEQSRLVRGSETTKLDPKAVQVLSFLAKHPDEVVTKEQIIASVWDGAFVSDEVLTTAIWGLRKALGDDAKEPLYIQTIPRRGYRLIAPVERATAESSRKWEPSPYPGLASFSQRDAEYFFGREEEVEALWKKIHERNLLGLIGPSGAGKSSLLRAGLIPAAPDGWEILFCKPRADEFERLSKALEKSPQALWIVDQFEELFTLHDEGTQGRVAELLGRAAGSGIHVLLSMRDDFLMRCHGFPALEPIFEKLTPVKALEGVALRRALTEPARASGYSFEDGALPSEILTEVSRDRGALPLLAFAASKLWEKRDREKRSLTREAYLSIGRVAGALAKYAEETLSEIGSEYEPVVREIFRNLVTAHGTRVPATKEELLSVFAERERAAQVLGKLVDARLLTSAGSEVEIIHESLLTAWPRLVRWQTQDADAAVLRDQLRQAARHWEDRRRPGELLWTGTPYREFELWRERYAGGLTSVEGAYATAMVAEARRRRTRQLTAVGVTIGLLLAGVGVMSSLWRRAVLEVSRREAAQILALGRLELENRPTAALAHALASLERADTDEARRFAVEALWQGAAMIVLPGNINNGDFSPDGKWIATGGFVSGVRLWSREGGLPKTLAGPDPKGPPSLQFNREGDLLAGGPQAARFWSIPEGKEIGRVETEGPMSFFRRGAHLLGISEIGSTVSVSDWRDYDEAPSVFASFDRKALGEWDFDSTGELLVSGRGKGVYVSPLRGSLRNRPDLVGKHDANIVWVASDPTSPRLVSGDETGEIRIWRFSDQTAHLESAFRAPAPNALLAPGGSWMTVSSNTDSSRNAAYVWDLEGPPDAEPRVLRDREAQSAFGRAIHPEGSWLLTAHSFHGGILWPLDGKYPRVLRTRLPLLAVAFTPDGKSLVSSSDDGTVRLWPLSRAAGLTQRILMKDEAGTRLGRGVEIDPAGKWALVSARFGARVLVVPLEGGDPRRMPGMEDGRDWVNAVALSPNGRLVAAAGLRPPVVRVWDLETGELRLIDLRRSGAHCWGEAEPDTHDLAFLTNRELLTSDAWGIRLWNIDDASSNDIRPCQGKVQTLLTVHRNSRRFLVVDWDEEGGVSTFGEYDPDSKRFREIASHGNRVLAAAIDPTGTVVVTGDLDGVVRAGPLTGEEPHLLKDGSLGVNHVAVSPDARWITSVSLDGTIRLWPMPEGQPFHTLPYEEILKRIRGLTNLRVVPDESAGSGYRVEVGPFPGWKSLPRW